MLEQPCQSYYDITILLKNVYSEIRGNFDSKELDNRLAIFYEGYQFSPRYRNGIWDGKSHFFNASLFRFATGLLPIIEEQLIEMGVKYNVVDLRQRPLNSFTDFSLNGIKLRDYQKAAVEAALDSGRGILELATASGKTEIACAITKALNMKTLFLVHTKDLLYQAKDRFQLRLGKRVGVIGDSEWDTEQDITVATVQSLHSKFKDNPVFLKEFLKTIKVLIIDECQHSSASMFYKIGMFCHNAYYRYGLSGTALRRDDVSNMKAIAVLGNIIHKIASKELIDNGVLSNLVVRMVKNPERLFEGDYHEVYQRAVVDSDIRNAIILRIVKKEFSEGKKILVLVTRVEHGERIAKNLCSLALPCVFLSGRDESALREATKQLFIEDKHFILVATAIFDEGIDLPDINVLVLTGSGNSEIKAIQRIGRGLRKKSDGSKLTVYDFNDSGIKYLKEHSKKRYEIYKKEGFPINDLKDNKEQFYD
jgi:superfamily II DNA or RNA helicase